MIAKKTCHCWKNQRVESLSKEKNLLLLKMVNETFEAFSCSLLVLTTAVVLLDTSPNHSSPVLISSAAGDFDLDSDKPYRLSIRFFTPHPC